MLLNHPYVSDTKIVSNTLPDGTEERILVVRTRLWWASDYSISNDNRLLMELSEQLRILERMAKTGVTDFDRVDLVPAE